MAREVTEGPDPIDHPMPGTHIWGWMTIEELGWICEVGKTVSSVVEIGSLRGRSAFAWSTVVDGPVYCVDPFDDDRNQSLPAFMENVGHRENVHPIVGYSPDVAGEVPGKVDLTFIDGMHDYASLVDDIDGWLPKTTKIICGHDYDNEGYPDVAEAVHDIFGGRVTDPAGMIWAVEL